MHLNGSLNNNTCEEYTAALSGIALDWKGSFMCENKEREGTCLETIKSIRALCQHSKNH